MSSETPVHISVVIPCYKSQKTIKELCENLVIELEKITNDFEVLLINDGSPDDLLTYLSGEVLPLDKRIVIVDLTRNFGQQSAILAGFEVAQGDFIVTMDDDLQQDPKDIKLMYDAIKERDDDVVVGSLKKKQHSLIRNMGTQLVKVIANKSLGVPFDLDLTSFRIIRGHIAKKSLLFHNIHPVVGFLLFMVTKKFSNVEVNHFKRNGSSSYSYKKLFDYFFNMLVNYSDLLLKGVSRVGLLMASFSFLFATYYLWMWLSGEIKVLGFATIVILQLFLFGILFIILGVLGAYLIRITKTTSRYPLFIVNRVIRGKKL